MMSFVNSKSVRIQDDTERTNCLPSKRFNFFKITSTIDGKQLPKPSLKRTETATKSKSLREKRLSRVFSEDYVVVQKKILDPRGTVINQWNKCFLVACLISLFVDPLFFYLPEVNEDVCMYVSVPFEGALTVIRTAVDIFYVINIFIRFRTAYVAPSSRVFGRGELVIDSSKIASKYFRGDFWFDLLAALPLPQVLIWGAVTSLRGSNLISAKIILRLTIISQLLLRIYLVFPLSSQIINANGVMVEAAWAGAAYNLMLFMLASHVIGSCWYLLAIERQEHCWKKICKLQQASCQYWYFDCRSKENPERLAWFKSSNISTLCGPDSDFFSFGIYADAFVLRITSSNFLDKYGYCLWWGLRNLSSIGQSLMTTTYIGEINFAITIAIMGLVLFALLIGNMQAYLQSTFMRLEEWRIKRTDTEQWMRHRQLPQELVENVRRYDLYEWVTTRGVDEEAILRGLPLELRRDIKRHLCLDLVRRVPLFDLMDDRMLDAICERLKPVLCTQGTFIVREGDPVNNMLFVIRGHLDSYTTDGGRTGFFNSCRLSPGDFCGDELLTWALDPRPTVILPSSTRTVKCISEVEAFAFASEDVKFVTLQFRKLHSKQMRHVFRFHSHQWRTWAACFIQAAWFRYKKRKEAAKLKASEGDVLVPLPEVATRQMRKSMTMCTTTSAASTRKCVSLRDFTTLQKPVEPDFSVDIK